MTGLVVDKLAAARILAARALKLEKEEVLELELAHRPGELGEVARVLGDAGVYIRHVFAGPAGSRKAAVFLTVSDMQAAPRRCVEPW